MFIVKEYKANKNLQKIVNLLKAIQQTQVAQEQLVIPITIKKCWWKSTLIKLPKEPVAEEDDEATEQAELQVQITQLLIKNPLSLNEFLTPNNKTVIDIDNNIFESVVEHYSINKLGKESDSSNKEKEVKKVDITKALKYVKLLKLQKLQKGNN